MSSLNQYLSFLASDPSNPNLLTDIAKEYRRIKQNKEALYYIEKAYALSKDIASLEYGLILTHMEYYEKAIPYFEHALKLQESVIARYHLSFCHYKLNHMDIAFDILAQLNPDEINHESQMLMAKILHHLNQLDEAILLLEHLVMQCPTNAEMLGSLCLLHFDAGHFEEAYALSLQTITIDARNYEALLVKAMFDAKEGKLTLDETMTLISIQPEDCRAWFLLGCFNLAKTNIKDAELAFNEAKKHHPAFYDNLISLAWCQLLQDKFELAFKNFTYAASINAHESEGLAGIAIIHHLQGNPKLAKEALDNITESQASFLSHVAFAMVYQNNDETKFNAHFEKAFPGIERIMSDGITDVFQQLKKTVTWH